MMKQLPTSPTRFLKNVLLKTLVLFVFINFGFAFLEVDRFSTVSAYNVLFPGRERFPFGENSQKAYNLSMNNLDAMFQAHRLDGEVKRLDEYRVFVIGDSSVWGSLLTPEETLAGQLDRLNLKSCDGRRVRVYNLGYPTLSLTKDLLILEEAKHYQPDLIVWMTTLEAFPLEQQLASPLVAANPDRLVPLKKAYNFPIALEKDAQSSQNWWKKTWIGQRRELADLVRLQLYGVLWAATGVDQEYPDTYPPAKRDFGPDENQFHGVTGPNLPEETLSFSILGVGIANAGVPVLVVNEPVLISRGENSQLRYNFYYPRWAYDAYRQYLNEHSQQDGWPLVDLWNLVDESDFTNSAIHLSPQGTSILAGEVGKAIVKEICR
jgi:hypothetical protein